MQRAGEQVRAIGAWLRRQARDNPLGSGAVVVGLLVLLIIVVETARQGNTGFGTKSLWDWLELLLVPLALGLGGSVFAFRLTRSVEARQERNALTVALYEQYLARFRDFARVLALLDAAQERELEVRDRNDVRDCGNWLDLVATLANQGLLNERLLTEWALDGVLLDFYRRTQALTFLQAAYAGGWRNLRRFATQRMGDDGSATI